LLPKWCFPDALLENQNNIIAHRFYPETQLMVRNCQPGEKTSPKDFCDFAFQEHNTHPCEQLQEIYGSLFSGETIRVKKNLWIIRSKIGRVASFLVTLHWNQDQANFGEFKWEMRWNLPVFMTSGRRPWIQGNRNGAEERSGMPPFSRMSAR
jgi:hypothetical protein